MTLAHDVEGQQAVGASKVGSVWLCLAAGCGLRFPAPADGPPILSCPRCGGEIAQVATAQPRPMPRSEHTGGTLSLHLLLDNWRSLFNVGSIFRTADGAGICEVHLCGITPTPAHRKLAKTALGAEIAVPWSYAPNAVARASELQAAGVAMWVLEGGEESLPLWECDPSPGRAVVLAAGNEVIGIDPGLLALADRVVHVPMLGHKESLNVAIALSVAVYWLVGQAGSRQRSHCATPGKTI